MLNLHLGKVSDSRVFFAGALGADTVCMGTLWIYLLAPTSFDTWTVGKVLLAALAITFPVAMFGALVTLTALREKIPIDDRSRKAILVAIVLHQGAQAVQLINFLVLGNARTLSEFFAYSAATVIGLAFVLVAGVWYANSTRLRAAKLRRHARLVDRRRLHLAQQIANS